MKETKYNLDCLIKNIYALCDENHITVEAMLDDCCIDKNVFCDMEKGFYPTVGKVIIIASYFEVSVDNLIVNEK